jgi:glycosyltransferase involved in cell wall biosynthesis
MIPVTVAIPVRNDAEALARCLEPLGDFAEVVVADSHSTDGSQEVARRAGATVLDFEWNGRFPKKRNWLLRTHSFKTKWVLFLDADELVTPEFLSELESKLPSAECAGYWITLRNHFQGRFLRFGVPFRKLALFRVGAGEYERIDEDAWSALDMEIHEHPVIAGDIGIIRAPIEHRDYRGLHHYLQKHNEYSTWEARNYCRVQGDLAAWSHLTSRQRKKYRHLAKLWWPWAYFVMQYFVRLGILDGRPGLTFACLKMMYFTQIRWKIRELQERGSRENG